MTLPPDTLPEALRARFRAERVLGEGTFGRVVLAWDQVLDRRVAVKLLRRLGPEIRGAGSRFRREARLLSKLASPAVVEIYDFGVGPDGAYLVLEYVDGPSLAGRLREPPGRLEAPEAERVADRLLEALAAMHGAGVVHRDLKPDNLLFTRAGELKVTDFGLSRSLAEEDTQTSTGMLVGTPAFMGPDQIDGSTRPGPGWDLYAAGVILWCAVAGEVPLFSNDILVLLETRRRGPGKGLRARGFPVSPGYDLLVSALLEPRPDARVPSAAEARRLLSGRPSGAVTTPLSFYGKRTDLARPGRTFLQRPEAALLGLVVLVGALAGPRASPPRGESVDTLAQDLREVAREGAVLELRAARERLESDPWIRETLALPAVSAPSKALHAWSKARGSFDTLARELNLRRTLDSIAAPSLSPAGLGELGRLALLHRLLSWSGFPGSTPLHETGPALDRALATALVTAGRMDEPPRDPDEQSRLFQRNDAPSGRRWRALRHGAALADGPPRDPRFRTRVLVSSPSGAPWLESLGTIPAVVQETLTAVSERAELAAAPRELSLRLEPVADELVLALTTDFFPPSLVATAEIVGKEETVLVPLPIPPEPPEVPGVDDPDRHTLWVRIRRGGLPSGLRLLRLRIVGIQAVAAAENALRIDQVYQLLAGPLPPELAGR